MFDLDLSSPQRQSIVGVVVIFFKNVRKALNAIFSILVLQFGMNTGMYFFWIILGIIIAYLLVLSILYHRNFVFYVEGDEFIIEKGVFSREKIAIPFARIQSIHINQNVIQRLLKVVGLKIDTAGSERKELEIAALSDEYARAIQQYLSEKRDELKTESTTEQDQPITSLAREKEPLIQLTLMEVIKVGLTENHFRTFAALFALFNGYYWQNREIDIDVLSEYIGFIQKSWLDHWITVSIIMVIAFVIISVVLSIMQSLLKNYGLRFFVDAKGVQLISGLLKRIEYQIPINKIQFLKWSTNPFRKLFGLNTLVVKQASSQATADKLSMSIPGCSEMHIEKVLDEFFPERKLQPLNSIQANSFLAYRLIVVSALIPALLLSILALLDIRLLLIPMAWLTISVPLAIKYAASVHLDINAQVIQLRKGWLFPNTYIIKYHKLQNVGIQQSIFQKRRNLAHLVFYSAAGSLRMLQLDEQVAQDLYDYILYQIESSNKSWM